MPHANEHACPFDSLRNTVVGVTGAAHGIGEATACRLLTSGARVLMIDRDANRLFEVRDRLTQRHCDHVLAVCSDVDDDEATSLGIADAVSRWGGINNWVNVAAVNPWGDMQVINEDDFTRGWRINCLAPWRLARLILPHVPSQGGAIVHVSTVMTRVSLPGNTAYVSAKSAIEGLTRAMAVELAPRRIRVNAVRPGYIDSGRRDPGRRPDDQTASFYRHAQPWPDAGLPEHVADTVAFLLSDAAAFITGATLDVDGGLSIRLPIPDTPRHDQAGTATDEKERCGDDRTQ